MAREPESENSTPGSRRRWFQPRKSDLAFLLGAIVFGVNGIRGGQVDPTVVYGSIALMGFAAAGRIDDLFGGGNGGRR